MTRKPSAPSGPPISAPMTTSSPPRPARSSVVRIAAPKLERLVVVIECVSFGDVGSYGEYTEPHEEEMRVCVDVIPSRFATISLVTTAQRRRERQEWNP